MPYLKYLRTAKVPMRFKRIYVMAISKKSVLPDRKPYITRKRTVEVPMIFAARRRSNKVGPTKALKRDNTREIEIINIIKLNIIIAH